MLDNLPLGAHLTTPRWGYTHHGIYAGDGRVIHYAGFSKLFRRGPVEEVSLEQFTRGRGLGVKIRPTIAVAQARLQRAQAVAQIADSEARGRHDAGGH